MKISPILRQGVDGNKTLLFFWCPGCNECHQVNVAGDGVKWTYNDNALKPTFAPSLLVSSGHYVPGQPQPPNCRYCKNGEEDGECYCALCHSFINDGLIQFLGDCTHHLAGKTVPIPDWPEQYQIYGGTEPIHLE